jgi:hypothetical protein
MNDALYNLYVTRAVSFEDCVRASHDPIELARMCGVPLDGADEKKPGSPTPSITGSKR